MKMSIEQNIKCRQEAAEIVEIMKESGFDLEQLLAYITQELQIKPKVIVCRDKPMQAAELSAFENSQMEFGKYIGQQIKDVPLNYLLWLDDEFDFRRALKRYLASDEIQKHI